GGEVTATIRNGMVDANRIPPDMRVYGMLSAMLSAGIWLLLASMLGWPVSTTHSIVGSIVGFAAVGLGVDSVHWDKITGIVISWIASPLLAGIIAMSFFRPVQVLILSTDSPFANAKKSVPYYMF